VSTLVLTESFDSTAAWALANNAAPATGRTGVGVGVASSVGTLTYTIPSASESDTVTVGFAWKIANVSAARPVIALRSDAGATTHLTVTTTATGALEVRRGTTSGTVLASSAASVFAAATWYYVELQAKLHDTAGFVTLRLNGTTIASNPTCDTKNAGTKTTFDQLFLTTGSTVQQRWDDLYLVTGADGAFLGVQRYGTDTSVLEESFTALTGWTTAGSPAIVAGRNGQAVELVSNSDIIKHAIDPAGSRSYQCVVGFALKITGTLATTNIIKLNQSGATKNFVRVVSDGSLTVFGSVAPTPINTIVGDGAWRYVEVMLMDGGSGAGAAEIRVNGATVGSAVDQNILSVTDRFDQLELSGVGVSGAPTMLIDDLYLRVGTLSTFEGDHVVADPITATMSVWDGAAFDVCPVATWSGSAFVDAVDVKTWDGAAFV
jgi:hypothetical protein